MSRMYFRSEIDVSFPLSFPLTNSDRIIGQMGGFCAGEK